MTDKGRTDPRRVANLCIEMGKTLKLRISRSVLQQILYFAHGRFMERYGSPLVSGRFQAWDSGPVHPGVHDALRGYDEPILEAVKKENILTGEKEDLPPLEDTRVVAIMKRLLWWYDDTSADFIEKIAKAKGAPWDVIRQKAKDGVAFGMVMSDDLIKAKFRQHLFLIPKVRSKPSGN